MKKQVITHEAIVADDADDEHARREMLDILIRDNALTESSRVSVVSEPIPEAKPIALAVTPPGEVHPEWLATLTADLLTEHALEKYGHPGSFHVEVIPQ